jgi:hypothetical protein
MDWFENISDFIYHSFEWLGPFIYGPIAILWILLLFTVGFIFKPISKVLRMPSKYQTYFQIGLFIAISLALLIMISISLSQHPVLDWMKD